MIQKKAINLPPALISFIYGAHDRASRDEWLEMLDNEPPPSLPNTARQNSAETR